MLPFSNSTTARLLQASLILFLLPLPLQAQSAWKTHDLNRPKPPVVTPPAQQLPVPAPADAIVLFDGSGLSNWQATDGSPTKWIVENGAMISVAGAGYIQSKQTFGDLQVHLEWAAPLPVMGSSQGRGNSGVFLMGMYEVQVLDSYENETYADGQAAALYGQHPPLVNASRPPGEWQSYDIYFRHPRFSTAGALLDPARITVVHNGLLVQNNAVLWGPTNWLHALPYQPHPDKLPLAFQDHGNPVRYRNIWVRELRDPNLDALPTAASMAAVTLSQEVLDRYVGEYQVSPNTSFTIQKEGGVLRVKINDPVTMEMVPHSPTFFSLKQNAGDLTFTLDAGGVPESVTFSMSGTMIRARKVK